MDFRIITPAIYWALIVLWTFVFVFYLRKLFWKNTTDKFFRLLLVILAVDAFRTLLESMYFGAWYTSLTEIIPLSIYEFLAQPKIVFFPKLINLIASFLILFMIIRKWLPEESNRIETLNRLLTEKTKEIEAANVILRSEAQSAIENKERYKKATINSPFPIMIHAEDGEVILVNKTWTKITGYEHEEINTIAKWTEKAYGEKSTTQKQYIDKLYTLGEAIEEGEFTISTKSGKQRIWEFSSAPLDFSEDGRRMVISTAVDITHKKKTANALAESNQYNRTLFEQTAIGLALTSIDGKLVDVNAAFATIVGYSIEEMLQLSYWDITPEKYADEEKKQLESIRKNNRYGPFEKEYIHKDGHLVPVRLQGKLLTRDGVNYIWSSIEDITETKQAHLSILESEKQFRSLIEQSGDAMYLVDFDGNIITVNKKACEFLGYERHELLQLKIGDIDANYTSKDDQMKLWNDLVPGESYTLETQHKRKNDELIAVEVILGLYEFSNKKAILGFARDITERKQSEELMRESESRIRTKLNAILLPEGNLEVLSLEEILDVPAIRDIMENIFKITGVAVALGDLDGRALAAFGWQNVCTQFHRSHPESCKNCTESDTLLASEVESGAYKLYKCKNNLWDLSTPIHVGNRHVGNIFVGQFFFKNETPDLAIFKKQAKQYGFNEHDYLLALEKVPRVSRETVDALAVFYAQFSSMISNLSYSSIKFAKIVNQQKQADDKIKQLNEELENKVLTRTAELERKEVDLIDSQNALLNIVEDLNEKSEQLEKNAAALEAVNKELESFSYSVSHDLRAPLRGIDGFSLALLEDYGEILDEEGRGYLNRVRKGTQKMALLIDEMLNLSRLGRTAIKPTTVNLSEITHSIMNELRMHHPQRSAEIIIANDVIAMADPILIRAVLQNLLENSWKFTSKKTTTIIEFGVLDIEGKRTYFVKDNGVGFNTEYSRKLFTPFQRLHQESEFPGTGIGLTTVQRIIHRHQGTIWAESQVNIGAVFHFTINL